MRLFAVFLLLSTGCRNGTDEDQDGVLAELDCNDLDATIFPGAIEICDGIDQNCDDLVDNSAVDASTFFADVDSDGFGTLDSSVVACDRPDGYVTDSTDCNDLDSAFYPGAEETTCTDPNDYNCDGSTGFSDADADGTPACEDCDDTNINVHPGAIEQCNGVDDNCDGDVDEDGAIGSKRYFADADADGFGDVNNPLISCSHQESTVVNATDCDDTSVDVYPGAPERCNGVDDDCNSVVDDTPIDGSTWFLDVDGDGAAGTSVSVSLCTAPAGYYSTASDCNDVNPAIHPNATEICDGIDNNCNTLIDESGSEGETIWYSDVDGDGFGVSTLTITACSSLIGYAGKPGDCDDSVASINPSAIEYCNGVDDNCDTQVDNGAVDASPWYFDGDGDGHGSVESLIRECAAPTNYVFNPDDCDDNTSSTYLNAPELCNGVDDNCDGSIDIGAIDAITFYRDSDGDGQGTTAETVYTCSVLSGFVANGDDCDDSQSTTYLGAMELCNGVDDDCDSRIDNGLSQSPFFVDFDGDGFGDTNLPISACAAPPGSVADDTDCDDGDLTVFPGALEVCDDGFDNDCDTFIDCLDNADCRDVEAYCWSCGDGYLSPDEECDDGNTIDGDGCSAICTLELNLTNVFGGFTSENRNIYIWKSDPTLPLSTYNTFCEDRKLQWFVPKSQPDAQLVIDNAYAYDNFHTWIITKNNTSSATWGGFSVVTNSPGSGYSTTGFSAIRKWSTSFCDPEVYDTTRCWDTGHLYDWLVCQNG